MGCVRIRPAFESVLKCPGAFGSYQMFDPFEYFQTLLNVFTSFRTFLDAFACVPTCSNVSDASGHVWTCWNAGPHLCQIPAQPVSLTNRGPPPPLKPPECALWKQKTTTGFAANSQKSKKSNVQCKGTRKIALSNVRTTNKSTTSQSKRVQTIKNKSSAF